ncbi:MAG TPA: SAM-dependent methyltransferase [Thermoanaerobaculia bacterium]|nr:SAM-dependent methyltransferase [Thermoanaerobaculia bacterium]
MTRDAEAPAGSPAPALPLLLSVLLLSASGLAFEVLVMRLLSIVSWHHFAYMVISLALLGFGASGTFLSLLRDRLRARFAIAYLTNATLFGLTAFAGFAIGQRLPFNPLELAWDPRQVLWLTTLYLLLAVPFFCLANAIGLALDRFPTRIHQIYRADLLGAGLGAAAAIGLLFLLHPVTCLELVTGLGPIGAGLAAWDPGLGRRRRLGTALVGVGLLLPLLLPAGWSELRISQFKGLAAALRVPEAEIVAEESGPMGLLTVVASPAIPFRHAPGLSLAFPGSLPEQLGVFTDADSLSAMDRLPPSGELPGYLDYLTTALPYHLLERPSVLVVGAGGGAEVSSALAHGARRIDAVEANPAMAALVTGPFDEHLGGLFRRDRVTLEVAEARSFMAAEERRWDLIQISLVDSFSAAAAGSHATSESTLYTIEALAGMLERLETGGMVALTRWLNLPPRDTLKLFATAVLALERSGVIETGRHLAWIRSWNTATLLVGNEPFTPGQIEALREFAEARSFDLAWYPGMREEEANLYNVLPEPYLHQAARALLGPERASYLDRYKFYITPATDQRPYFFRFFEWETLPELLELRGRGGTPLIQWSYLIVAATLLQAVLAAAVLILLPLLVTRRSGLREPGVLRVALLFLALGLAFLFVEIAMIHHLSLFLGHPLYSVAVVLGTFLVFAGLGSGASPATADWLGSRKRLPESIRSRARGLPAAAATLVTLLYLLALPPLLDAGMGLPDPARILLAVVLLAPLAFLMGMPFPLGLARAGARNPDWVPWAWGVNGAASVLSAVLAALLAMHLGFSAVLGIAALLYLAVAALLSGL